MDAVLFASHWDPEDERIPSTATPVVFGDTHEFTFAASHAKIFRGEQDPRYASTCRPSTVFWGKNKYTAAQIKKMIGNALRGLPPHPQAHKAPIHHYYPVLRQALDGPIRAILHGEADPNLAVGSAVLWYHIDNILEGRTTASGEGRYSSDVMVQFALKMVTSGTRCHFIAGGDYLGGTRDFHVKTPSVDYHRVRALRLGAFALTVNDASHWTAVLHHLASGTTYVFEPGPRPPATRWGAHLELRINFNRLLLQWGLAPTSSYVVMGGEPQLGTWQCGYILILQFLSFLHSDGLLQWDKSDLYQGLQTAQAREAYGMRKIADWALHLWTGEQEVCCPSPEMSELLTLSERLIQTSRMASLKSKYPGLPAKRGEVLPSAPNAASLLDKGNNGMALLRLLGPARKRTAAPRKSHDKNLKRLSVRSISAGSGISKRPTVRERASAPPDATVSPWTWRRALGKPLYPHFTPAGWKRPAGLAYDAAAAHKEVLARYADPSFRKAEAWQPKGSQTKGDELQLGGELGRAYRYLLAMVSRNPDEAAKIGLSPAALLDCGAWIKLVTALVVKRGDPIRALEYIGRRYPRIP